MCRSRKQHLERGIAEFLRQYRSDPQLPPSAEPRAILKNRLAELAQAQPAPWRQPANILRSRWMTATAFGVLAVGIIMEWHLVQRQAPEMVLAAPNPVLTPGAAGVVNPMDLCQESMPNNKRVPSTLRRRVFQEYGIANAPAKAYELDYLITPALGGSDDIHNLWPHSYANTEWNAKVKDALEERLRDLVCEGKVDLSTAQREISTNWINAYKKYFHTGHPIDSKE